MTLSEGRRLISDNSYRSFSLVFLFVIITTSLVILPAFTSLSYSASSFLSVGDIVSTKSGTLSITPSPDVFSQASGPSTPIALGRPLITVLDGLSIFSLTNDAPPTGPIPAGAVGYWSFDNDARDASGKGNDATLSGGTLERGKIGRALSLNGDGKASVPHSQSLHLTASYSISVWVKMETLNPTSDFANIIEKADSYDHIYYMFYSKLSKTISFGFKYNGQFNTVSTLKNDWSTDKWYHIVGTYNPAGSGNNMKIYVNGMVDNTEKYTTSPVSISGDLVIGGTAAIGKSNW